MSALQAGGGSSPARHAALGVLIKGPVAVVLLLLVSVPILWLERGRARVPARWVAGASGVAALIAAPWYVAMIAVHGTPYVSSFFVADNLERFATTRFNAMRPPWFYLPILAGGLLPWTPVAVCCVAPAATWLREKTTRTDGVVAAAHLAAAAAGVLYRCRLASSRDTSCPSFPLWRFCWRVDSSGHQTTGWRAGSCESLPSWSRCSWRCSVCCSIARAPLSSRSSRGWCWRARASSSPPVSASPSRRLRVRLTAVPLAVGIAGAITLGGLQYGLAPAGRDPVQLMADLVLTERQPAVPVATYHAFVRNLVFYAGIGHIDLSTEAQLRAFIARPEPVLCVIPARELERVGRTQPLNVRTLGEVEYLDASPVKLRALFASNPARSLQRVLLVTNVRGDDDGRYALKIFPGFRMPRGSNACLIRRSSAISSADNSIDRNGAFEKPMPCSPVIDPSSATTPSNSSRSARRARATASRSDGSTITLTWMLPSPA